MRKKLILGVLGLLTVVAGVAAMSAFTAQMVNIQARVEKDITVEPVICDETSEYGADYSKACWIDPKGGDYGVTLPQVYYDKEIEVTLSNSFDEQDRFYDVKYWILWECKQFADERDEVTAYIDPDTGELVVEEGPDTIPDCREYGLDDTVCTYDTDGDDIADTVGHCDPEYLDGNIRDHIEVEAKAAASRCLDITGTPAVPRADQAAAWEAKKIEWVGDGMLNKAAKKCRYELKFFAPPCETGWNPYTDPHPDTADKIPIECNYVDKDTDGNPEMVDPQDIDEFADLGDEFKIQITAHSLAP